MKRLLARTAALTLATCASLAAAQNAVPASRTYFGLYGAAGYAPDLTAGVGAQLTYDANRYALRLGLSAQSVLGYTLGFGGDVAALYPVYGDLNTRSRISLGVGLDASLHNGAGGGGNIQTVLVRPHVLLNAETRLFGFSTIFAEASLGYTLGQSVSPGLRLGLNFR